MEFEALQQIRESCRIYSDKKVKRELLTHLVEIARLFSYAIFSFAISVSAENLLYHLLQVLQAFFC